MMMFFILLTDFFFLSFFHYYPFFLKHFFIFISFLYFLMIFHESCWFSNFKKLYLSFYLVLPMYVFVSALSLNSLDLMILHNDNMNQIYRLISCGPSQVFFYLKMYVFFLNCCTSLCPLILLMFFFITYSISFDFACVMLFFILSFSSFSLSFFLCFWLLCQISIGSH